MAHEPNETLRKSIHVAVGLFAFTLKWIPWWLGALAALFAIFGNWLILHRLVGKGVSRDERGWDWGIVLYPLAVFILLLVFWHQLPIAAVAWTTLAFGDGFATLIGKRLPRPSLPWNPEKSAAGFVAFIVFGLVAGYTMAWWLGGLRPIEVAAAVVVGAIVETLPLGVNDNITVPFAAAVTLAIMTIHPALMYRPWPRQTVWLLVHTGLAILGWVLRTVDFSGFIAGWIVGAAILLGAGWPLYVTLLAFFVIGTITTHVGYARKKAAGMEQEHEGRRGFIHAFSNVGVAALCAIALSRYSRTPALVTSMMVPLFMGVAALATAAADTTASEIGQLIGKRPFLPLSLRRVEPGTEGAISLEGTFVGIIAAMIVATVGTIAATPIWPVVYRTRTIAVVTVCALIGSYLESIAGSWNRRHGSPVPNGVLNFFNTVCGALLLYYAWPLAI